MHSVESVLNEFQHRLVGDTIDFGANSMRLARVESDHVLAMRSRDGNWAWTFVLEEHRGNTRLLSRNRYRLSGFAARLGIFAMEPCSLVMEREMLRGIKRRAELLAAAPALHMTGAATAAGHRHEPDTERAPTPTVGARSECATGGETDVGNAVAAAPAG